MDYFSCPVLYSFCTTVLIIIIIIINIWEFLIPALADSFPLESEWQ